jgi:hypothetical protein
VFKYLFNRRCFIHEDNYTRDLEKFEKLFQEAKKDFPSLTREDVKVFVFNGDTHKGQCGIDFTPPADTPIPVSYKQVTVMEYVL